MFRITILHILITPFLFMKIKLLLILSLLPYWCFAQDTTSTKKKERFLKINVLLGGRWQSAPIKFFYTGVLPMPQLTAAYHLPYSPLLNINGLGFVGGIEGVFKDKVSLSFKPVYRYDYLQSDPFNGKKIKKWIWDLHFNAGYVFKKNTIGIGYSLINAGKFLDMGYNGYPTIKLEFFTLNAFYTREIKKRFVAEIKLMFNYKDFPTHVNLYNTPDELYKREYLFVNLGCAYRIGLIK